MAKQKDDPVLKAPQPMTEEEALRRATAYVQNREVALPGQVMNGQPDKCYRWIEGGQDQVVLTAFDARMAACGFSRVKSDPTNREGLYVPGVESAVIYEGPAKLEEIFFQARVEARLAKEKELQREARVDKETFDAVMRELKSAGVDVGRLTSREL